MPARWNIAGSTELNLLPENETYIPVGGGAGNTITLQQTGFLNKLRGWLDADVVQTVSTLAAVKSTWGALGGSVRRLRARVQGRKPFFDISGYGLSIYNEVANPDASVFAPHPYLAGAADVVMAEGTHLDAHTAGGLGAQVYQVQQPFELLFGLPVWMTRLIKMGKDFIPVQCEEEVGLWLLEDRETKLAVDVDFYPAICGTLGVLDPQGPYCSADIAATWDPAENRIRWEREFFSVPPDFDAWPDQAYIHQVIEYRHPIVGSAFRFPIPQVGSLLRAIMIFEDLEEGLCSQDVLTVMPTATIALTFGASDAPIVRPMWAFVEDYLHDYKRYPPIGTIVFDFYKAGREAARLARDTDRIANMAFVGITTGLVTGTVRIILESLVPHRVVS